MISWICKKPGVRHTGQSDTMASMPTVCPFCTYGVELRKFCACGHNIDDCNQSICSHPFARDD